jgi:hypothetical protein
MTSAENATLSGTRKDPMIQPKHMVVENDHGAVLVLKSVDFAIKRPSPGATCDVGTLSPPDAGTTVMKQAIATNIFGTFVPAATDQGPMSVIDGAGAFVEQERRCEDARTTRDHEDILRERSELLEPCVEALLSQKGAALKLRMSWQIVLLQFFRRASAFWRS